MQHRVRATFSGLTVTEIVLHHMEAVALPLSTAKIHTALDLWLSGFSSENTRRAYCKEIGAFAAFAGWDDVAEAVTHFLALEDGPARAVADKWRAEKIARGLSPSSVNRSMAALNSLVASARRHGITTLRLEAKGVRSKSYRDTKGPGLWGVQAILAVATDHKRPEKAARDAAIIRLAYGLGLRRGEMASLNIGHCDLMGGTLHVLGKGRSEREAMTIPANVKHALSTWLSVRGADAPDAPLFVALDNHSRGRRAALLVSNSGVHRLEENTYEDLRHYIGRYFAGSILCNSVGCEPPQRQAKTYPSGSTL
jgi:integrase/recombinase XerC